MATQTTIQQQLPPGYVTGIGEQFSNLFGSQETNEGLKAFVEKRKANFKQ